MKNTLRNTVAGGLALAGSVLPAKGLEAQTTVNAENTIASRYMWNGIPFSEGPVYQPQATISSEHFSTNIFTSYDFRKRQATELDISAKVSGSRGSLDASLEWRGVTFEDGGPNWRSFSKTAASLGLRVPLHPSVSFDWFNGYDTGLVTAASVEGNIPGTNVSWKLGTTYNPKVFTEDKGFSNVGVDFSAPIKKFGMEFTPEAHYSLGLSSNPNVFSVSATIKASN